MDKQNKRKIINISFAVIVIISVVLNVFLINLCNKLINQVKTNENQILNSNEDVVDSIDNNENDNFDNNEIVEKEEPEKEYIYKYIEGKEKQVIVEKKVEKTIEIPVSPTDATVTYIDASGNSKSINIPSGTTIDFSAGEHGTYDTVPSSITLTDNQELDITGSSYNPSKVEVNYIFKGFSYSGNTMKCEYSLANNTVNVDHKQIDNAVIINDVVYIKHEYLESTGAQYINTNITLPNDCVLDIDIQFTDTSIMNLIGTVGDEQGRADFGVLNNKWFCYMGDYFYGDIMNADTDKHSFKMDYKNKKFSIDGNVKKTFTVVKGTQKPYYLFARYDISSVTPYAYCRLYRWTITQNDIVKYDLIPAERTNDGTSGMLDQQNGTFYTNSGSGEFIHPDIKLLPGINAGKVMASGSYEFGSALTLTAVANDGYKFAKWLDGNTNATITINVENTTVYTALFVANN